MEDRVEVYLGIHNLSALRTDPNVQRMDGFISIFIHDDYDAKTAENDIALIQFIDQRATFTQHVRAICLPPKDFVSSLSNETLYVAGFANEYFDDTP